MPSIRLLPLLLLAPQFLPAAEIDFAHEIVPILREHCAKCHTGTKKQGGLSINTREALLAGGENGKVVVPGKGNEGELLKRITSSDADLRMPPEGPALPAAKIALLKKWIEAGLPWDDGFTFRQGAYEPPLKPRRPELPPAVAGRANPIDRLLDAYQTERKIACPAVISDAEFARRVHLDLVGLLPEPERLAKFLADRGTDKRERLVQELLANDVAYAEHWLTFWNDLLRNDYTGTGFITGGRKQITKWLYAALVENKPYDKLVRDLIVASPDSEGFIQGIRWRGDVNASQTVEVQFAQSISQALLGINMKCASCHDSFVDRWKLEEAYGLAAIYSTQPLAIYRCDKPTGKTARASWIFPELGQINAEAPQPERMRQLADLITHPENGRLTRTIVNRLWHRLMGRGIVHPTDAMHTEPWNADLLDYLAVHLADQKYDLKQTLALICNSQAYQSATPAVVSGAEAEEFVFRGPAARRMTAEQFMDAVWQLTGAGPTKIDAQVQRGGKPNASSPFSGPAQAKWIWSYKEASASSPASEAIVVRKQFELAAAPQLALAAVTCDNAYSCYVNGQLVNADDNWETVEGLDLTSRLQKGSNVVLIVARNGAAGGPAGLFVEVRVQGEDGKKPLSFGTDGSWEWTKSLPNAQGKFAKDPGDWKPAVEVANPAVWSGRVNDQIAAALSQAAGGSKLMVRASLVKSDALMRSLGRPNRDQIVTMRPSDLTTLEAIDLSNAPLLAETLQRGAQRLRAQAGADREKIVNDLFQFALSRSPTADELAAASELLGETASAEQIEDLLWSVLMLPEFQLIR